LFYYKQSKKMEDKIISVILPIYNGEEFLNRCIDSIISQTYRNIELILINDGSTDNTKRICEEYARNDIRIKVINKENEGVSKARNIGIKQSKGKYITFIDADDWIDNNAYENAIKVMEEKNVDILKFSYMREYGRIKKYYNYIIDKNTVILKKDYDNKIYPYMFSTYDMSSVCLTIFKREKIGNLEFDLNLKYGEDFLFITQAILRTESIYVLPNAYYHYFCNNNSATNKRNIESHIRKIKDIVLANNKLFGEFKDNKKFLNLKNKRILKECNQVIKYVSLDNNYRNFKKIIKGIEQEILIPLCPEIKTEHIFKKYNFLCYIKMKIFESIKNILRNFN